MTQPTTQKRAESSLSMYLTGAAQLQSEGLPLCNDTQTVRGLKRFAVNPALSPDACPECCHAFQRPPTPPPQHVTHEAFLVSHNMSPITDVVV